MRIDLLISIIIAALIIFGLIVAFTLNLIDLMTNVKNKLYNISIIGMYWIEMKIKKKMEV